MKVLLVNPKAKFTMEILTSPLGLISIATYLNANGHTARIYDSGSSKEGLCDVIREFEPDIVGVSVISGKAVDDAVAISNTAKSAGITVVWGGYLPSAMPDLVLKNACVDMVAIGEGEYTLLEVLGTMEAGQTLETVAGLAFMKNGELVKTPGRDFVDLASLPMLDFSLIDIERYIYPYYFSKRTFSLYSSKGCTGHCTFCYNASFNKSRHRVRPPEQVVREMAYLTEKYGVDSFSLNDDLIFCNKEEMYRFCSLLQDADLRVSWGSSCVIGLFGKDDLRYMYQTGCRWLMFGVESGSREILSCIRKNLTTDEVERTCDDCAEIGIVARAGIIIGFPGETEKDLKETAELAMRLKTSQVSVNYYTVVPASASYKQLLLDGTISPPQNLEAFIEKYSFDKLNNLSCVPDRDLKVIYSYFIIKRHSGKRTDPSGQANSWTKITADSLLRILRTATLSGVFAYFSRFVSIFFHYFCFRGIKKKYGLR
ncbi:MAG TPA: radical SAM protein [Clostridiales bacterium]|nr:radical SAM protein [Clostridiales bacterium]HQK73569.1 radical SAM protein [Clostridiales bacterium]